MLQIEEKILEAKQNKEQLKRLQKAKERQEKAGRKKKDQRRCFVIGELVVKHFPEVLNLEPGTNAENQVRFHSLDAILTILEIETGLLEHLKKKAQFVPMPSERVKELEKAKEEQNG